jgi:peptide/nickel transport system permease protein
VLQYIAKRLLIMIPTLFGILVVSFLMIRLAPGDPAAIRFGALSQASAGMNAERGTQQAEKLFRERWLLDKPLPVQFGAFLKRLVTGDLQYLQQQDKPILPDLWRHLWVSAQLNLIVFFLIYLIAIPSGIFSAAFPHSTPDRIQTVSLFILYSLPSFFAAELLRMWLTGEESWAKLPGMGLHGDGADEMATWDWTVDYIQHLILPVTCLTYSGLAYISRQMRAGLLEVIRQDYVRTARAKGCSEWRTILVHALRNGLFPIITLFASLLPFLVGGSVIIETIFNIEGMGWYAFNNVLKREYDVVMASLMLSAVMTLLGILVSDILYGLVNPQVAYDG